MKTLLCLCLAVYVAVAIPLENVEDDSYFIEFADDDDVMSPLDLEKQPDIDVLQDVTRNPSDNRYLLYTRQNTMASQTLRIDNANSITLSRFDAKKPTVVVVHGWIGHQHTDVNLALKDTFLRKSDVNIIVMEWRRLAISDYFSAVAGVPGVGRGLGQFLKFLNSVTGASFDTMHLIGFSLGAHIVGLDPAGPFWNFNNNRLRPSDGIYVEAIHTDGGLIGLGIGTAIADADFFPNGGTLQPGCLTPVCNHNRAWELFAASVTYDHLVGVRCSNMVQVFMNNCRGEILKMGNNDLRKKGSGIYRVNTVGRYPY